MKILFVFISLLAFLKNLSAQEQIGWYVHNNGFLVRNDTGCTVQGGRPNSISSRDTLINGMRFKALTVVFDTEFPNENQGFQLLALRKKIGGFQINSTESTSETGAKNIFLVPARTKYIALKYREYVVFKLD